MSASDVIAVVSAVVALLAFALGYYSYRLQKSSAAGDDQEQFDHLISRLTTLLGKAMSQTFTPQAPGAAPANVAVQGILNELQIVGAQAHRMLNPTNPSDSKPTLDWYSAYILANVFDQAWLMKRAGDYWDIAVTLSVSDPQSNFVALQGRAAHHYGRNNDGDVGLGRDDVIAALKLLDPNSQGIDASREQAVTLHIGQANCELGVGNPSPAIDCVWQAWEVASTITTPWRHQRTMSNVCNFIYQNGGVEPLVDHRKTPVEEGALRSTFSAWLAQMQMQITEQPQVGAPAGPTGVAVAAPGADQCVPYS